MLHLPASFENLIILANRLDVLEIRSLNRVVLQLKQHRDVQCLSARQKCSRHLWMPSAHLFRRWRFAFSWCDSGWKSQCSGFPSVAFSEQEEDGTNDRYRNEVTRGPLWGRGMRASVELYPVHGAERCHSADGKLWHYLCLCEWQSVGIDLTSTLLNRTLLHVFILNVYLDFHAYFAVLCATISVTFSLLLWWDILMLISVWLWPRILRFLMLSVCTRVCVSVSYPTCSLKGTR